jgi:hypothetical protein
MFDDGYMEALVGILAPTEMDLIRQKGFIVGRVTDHGRPVAGAHIDLAGDFAVEPIYFNEMFLPDRGQKSTSSNGLFAAILLEPSLYSVRAVTNGVYLPAQVLPVEAGKVTQALLDRKEIKSLAVNLVPFPENSSPTETVSLSILGTEEEKEFRLGSQVMQYQEGRGLFVLESLSGPYDPMVRMVLPHGISSVKVPVINRHWLEGVATKKRINLLPEAGRILGFGPSEEFEAVVDKGGGPEEIVYLDPDGKPLYEGQGLPSGSFLIFNLKPGIHTISVLTRNGSKIFSRVVLSEYGVVNVVSPDLL